MGGGGGEKIGGEECLGGEEYLGGGMEGMGSRGDGRRR